MTLCPLKTKRYDEKAMDKDKATRDLAQAINNSPDLAQFIEQMRDEMIKANTFIAEIADMPLVNLEGDVKHCICGWLRNDLICRARKLE
jgi:hypothetical protein